MKLGHHVFFYNLDVDSSKYKRAAVANIKPNLWGRLAKFWPLLGIPLSFMGEVRIFFIGISALKKEKTRPDIVYFRHAQFGSGLWMAKWLKVPAVKEVNGIVTHEMRVIGQASGFTLAIIDRIEKFILPKADKLIVVYC